MSWRERYAAALKYFQEAVAETDKILEEMEERCSPDLRRELRERREHFEAAVRALGFALVLVTPREEREKWIF